jgi:L-ascorbate metabolism protein UlaG (beta-lactamase superfamily)
MPENCLPLGGKGENHWEAPNTHVEPFGLARSLSLEVDMPRITFLGHSCCTVEEGGRVLLIDPFLTGNPLAAARPDQLQPTAILVSHAHNDHLGDAIEIARRSGATIVSNYEIATWCEKAGAKAHGMQHGGAHAFEWGWVKLTLAFHGSTLADENGFHTLGNPAGFLIRLGDRMIYHAGDTALFGDMALIGRRHPIDLALLPIGDNFTMGPDDAVEAVQLLRPRRVVPIHYNTFDLIAQDAQAFCRRVSTETQAECVVLAPGESVEI